MRVGEAGNSERSLHATKLAQTPAADGLPLPHV
jgi:hypothetical protein